MTTERTVEKPTETTIAPLPARVAPPFNLHEQWELILFLIVAMIGAGAALAGAPVAFRLVFGLPLVVFIPGYALVTTLFPSSEGLDGLERIALSVGLSLAMIPLMTLGIEFSPWKLALGPIAGGLLSLSILLTGTAIWRRRRLSKDLRFVAEIPRPSLPPVATWDRAHKVAAGMIVVSLLVFGGSGTALVAQRLRSNPSTEFAIFNQSGQAAYYPRDFSAGRPQQVQLEIENREGRDVNYSLDVVAGSTTIGSVDSIHVASGDTWQRPVTIQIPPALMAVDPGQPLALSFNLYRGHATDAEAPYRSLRLFIKLDNQTARP
jgi:uncharacterized membrane protein